MIIGLSSDFFVPITIVQFFHRSKNKRNIFEMKNRETSKTLKNVRKTVIFTDVEAIL
jgi:hypothetical protein